MNYNGGKYLQPTLDYLQAQTRPADEVIIVDNASTDGSADSLNLDKLPQARLRRLDKNVGFAKANNVAAEKAHGNWLALLNPDTEAFPDWLEKLEAAIHRYPEVSMFASAQIDAVDRSIMDGAGDNYHVLGIPWRGGFGRPISEMPAEGECFSPCGASALFRKSTFLEAGGFDESYFCYCEDVDLGFRLRLRGERCMFIPDAVIHHHGSAISGRKSEFTIRLGTRNRLRTYLTSMPTIALAATFPVHLLANLYLYGRAIGKPYAKAIRHGTSEALGMLPEIRATRRRVQRTRTVSTIDLLKQMSWNPATLHGRKVHVRPYRAKRLEQDISDPPNKKPDR